MVSKGYMNRILVHGLINRSSCNSKGISALKLKGLRCLKTKKVNTNYIKPREKFKTKVPHQMVKLRLKHIKNMDISGKEQVFSYIKYGGLNLV